MDETLGGVGRDRNYICWRLLFLVRGVLGMHFSFEAKGQSEHWSEAYSKIHIHKQVDFDDERGQTRIRNMFRLVSGLYGLGLRQQRQCGPSSVSWF